MDRKDRHVLGGNVGDERHTAKKDEVIERKLCGLGDQSRWDLILSNDLTNFSSRLCSSLLILRGRQLLESGQVLFSKGVEFLLGLSYRWL